MKKHLDVVKEARDTHLLNMADANVASEEHDADTSKMAQDAYLHIAGRTHRDLLHEAGLVNVYREKHPGRGRLHLAHQEPNKPVIQMEHENQHGPAMCTQLRPEEGFVEGCKVRKYDSICAATTT